MKAAFPAMAIALALSLVLLPRAQADRFLNQTQEEMRPKKPNKSPNYEKSQYISKSLDPKEHYLYTEDGDPLSFGGGTGKGRGGKAGGRERLGGKKNQGKREPNASGSLANKRPRPEFKRMSSFYDQGAESHKAFRGGSESEGQNKGQGSQFQNFQTGAGAGYAGAGQAGGRVKVMP